MANKLGQSMVGGSTPTPPNGGAGATSGKKAGKAKRSKGATGKSFNMQNGTRSGVMRTGY